jgi:uncharacterized protein (DUF433 family)
MSAVVTAHPFQLGDDREPIYRFLEPKPYKQTCQLGIVGRNMTVWNLVSSIVLERDTPEEVAEDYDLPLETVHEALDYYHRHRTAIDAEIDEIGREFGLK